MSGYPKVTRHIPDEEFTAADPLFQFWVDYDPKSQTWRECHGTLSRKTGGILEDVKCKPQKIPPRGERNYFGRVEGDRVVTWLQSIDDSDEEARVKSLY